MSPQPGPQSQLENMLGDPDFHRLEPPEQRQLLRNGGMQDRSDQELDSLVSAARAYHGMSPLPPAGTPLGRFLGAAGQAFQAANPITGHPGEGILHMIGGPDPTTGETTADWARTLPGVSTYENLRQGRVAEELGSWMPSVALGLLTGGVAKAPEVWGATKTGAGATWAGLKGAGEAYSTEKTLWPSIATGALLEKLGEHLGIPYGAEVGTVLGASPTIGKGFIQGVRKYLNPIPEAGEAPTPFAPGAASKRNLPAYTPYQEPYGPPGKIIPRAGLQTEVKSVQEPATPVTPQAPAPFRKGKATQANMPAYGGPAEQGFTAAPRPGPAGFTVPEQSLVPTEPGPQVQETFQYNPKLAKKLGKYTPYQQQYGPPGKIIRRGPQATPPEAGPPKGEPVKTEPEMDWGREMNMFHSTVEDLPGTNPYARGGPAFSEANKKAPGYTGGLVKDLNLTTPQQLRALTNASRAAGRLLSPDEARAVIQNIK